MNGKTLKRSAAMRYDKCNRAWYEFLNNNEQDKHESTRNQFEVGGIQCKEHGCSKINNQ